MSLGPLPLTFTHIFKQTRIPPILPAPQSDNNVDNGNRSRMQFYSNSGALFYLDEEVSDPGLGAFHLPMAKMLDSMMIEWETIVDIALLGTRSELTGSASTTGLASTGSSFDIVLLGMCLTMKRSAPSRSVTKNYGES